MILNRRSVTNFLFFLPIALFTLLTLLPLIPVISYDYHNHQRISQLILLITVCTIVLSRSYFYNQKVQAPFDNKIMLVFFVFISMGLVSALFSKEPVFSSMYFTHFLLLINLLFYVNQYQTKQNSLFFIYFLVASHVSLLLICLLNIAFSIADGININVYIIYSGFINIRFFNHVQIFILPLLLMLLRVPNIRKVIIFMIGFNLYLMYMGQARGACIAWFVTLLFIYLTNKSYKKEVTLAFLISLTSLIVYLLIELYYQTNTLKIKTTSSGRIDMWINLISSLKLPHILLGTGPGIYESSIVGSRPFSHPHNSILELLNEWGGIATFLFSFIVLSTAKQAYKHIKRHSKDSITAVVFYAWLAGGVYSLVSGILVMPVPQTLFFVMWGVLISRTTPTVLQATLQNKKLKTLILISVIITIIFYVYNANYFYNLINPDDGYSHGPRFWSVGKRS